MLFPIDFALRRLVVVGIARGMDGPISREKGSDLTDVLHYSRGMKAFAVLLTGVLLAFALFLTALGGVLGALLFFGCAASSCLIVREFFRVRHVLVEGGLAYGQLFGDGGELKWARVTSIRYSDQMRWFTVEHEDGVPAHISRSLHCLSMFALRVLENVPRDRVEPKAHEMLLSITPWQPRFPVQKGWNEAYDTRRIGDGSVPEGKIERVSGILANPHMERSYADTYLVFDVISDDAVTTLYPVGNKDLYESGRRVMIDYVTTWARDEPYRRVVRVEVFVE